MAASRQFATTPTGSSKKQSSSIKRRCGARRVEPEKQSQGLSPTMLTLAGSVIAAAAALLTAAAGGMLDLILEREKQQFEILKQATAGLPIEQAAENLKFFVDIGYLSDSTGNIKEKAEEGNVPVFSSPTDPHANPLLERLAALPGSEVSVPVVQGYAIRNHILYGAESRPVAHAPTPNFGTQLKGPRAVVLHSSFALGESATKIFTEPALGMAGSVHLVIARDGTVRQLLPFDLVARHVGRSRWGSLTGLNGWTIGIDFENAGNLVRREGRWFAANTTTPIPDDEVFETSDETSGTPSGWHRFTDVQIERAIEIVLQLRQTYPSLIDVLSHDEVADPPGRKVDPGPTFPLVPLREETFGHAKPVSPP